MRLLTPLVLGFALACTPADDTDKGTDTDTDTVDTDTVDTDVDTTDTDTDDTDEVAPTLAARLAAGTTVQELLDEGYTPIEIYEADNAVLTTIYGSTYEGGFIFHLDPTDGTGLISDPGVTRDSYPWSGLQWACPGGPVELPGADGTAVGTGAQNTADIVAACPGEATAASACADLVLGGHDDWFLPSRDELQLMYTNLKDNGNQGNLHANNYWSSSDWSTNSAYYVFFATGAAGQDDKTTPDRVRAVRAF